MLTTSLFAIELLQTESFDIVRIPIYSSVPHLAQNFIVISSHPLTGLQRDDLSFDLNFSGISKPHIPNSIASFEHSFKNSKISSSQPGCLRFLLVNVISSNYDLAQKFNFSEILSQ